mgnify:CR=1 FL=1
MPGGHGSAPPVPAPTGLHPAFRILLLLVLAGLLFRYSLAAVALTLLVLLLAAAAGGREMLAGVLKAARRIRWLLLSIVVIYLWVAPEPGPAGSPWLPSWSELDLALRRSGVLLVLVIAVELLRRHTGAVYMAAGLVALLRPLARLGVDVETFAQRLALTLEAVPQTAERVAAAATGRRAGPAGWGEAAAVLVRDIEAQAVQLPETAGLPELGPPGARDWAWLALGVLACVLGSQL